MEMYVVFLVSFVYVFGGFYSLSGVSIGLVYFVCWGKTHEEMVKEMKSSSERILKWGYSTDADFPLDAPIVAGGTIY